jgi:serine/threonine-protein kinase
MRFCPRCLAITSTPQCPADGATTQEDPVMGERVDGRYLVVEPIGRGGMGSVYRALDEPLGRHVAVKVLKPSRSTDESAVGRFTREARVLAALRHPNTVVLHHWGQVPQLGCFMVTELLEGETLHARLRARGALSITDTLLLASCVARSLAQAHRRGIVHRDLKPANIFFDQVDGSDEAVKVLDFGIAKFFERPSTQPVGFQTSINDVVGTPAYLSPEQVRAEELDGRADLHALGVIMFQCLAGRLPFTHADPFVVMRMVRDDAPPPLPHGIPSAVCEVVMALLAKRREDRPQEAAQLARTLDALRLAHRDTVEPTLLTRAPVHDEPTVPDAPAQRAPRAWKPWAGGAVAGCVSTLLMMAAGPRPLEPVTTQVAAVINLPSPPPEPAEEPAPEEAAPEETPAEASAVPRATRPRPLRRTAPRPVPAEQANREAVASRLMKEANRLMVEGRFEEAEGRASMATSLLPSGVEGHKLLAVALARQGKFCDAAAHYRRALVLQPNDDMAGRIRDILKDPDLAACR